MSLLKKSFILPGVDAQTAAVEAVAAAGRRHFNHLSREEAKLVKPLSLSVDNPHSSGCIKRFMPIPPPRWINSLEVLDFGQFGNSYQ